MLRKAVICFPATLWLAVACIACTTDGGVEPGDPGILGESVSALTGGNCGAATLTVTPSGSDAVLTAGATCTTGTPEFRFFVRVPGGSAFSEIFSYGASTHTYTPAQSGRYTFIVHVRETGSAALYEAATTATGVVGPDVCRTTAVTAKPTSSSLGANNPVTLKASAVCTTGTPEYRFFARAPGVTNYTEIRPYGASDTLTYDPGSGGAAGLYSFIVWTRRQGNSSLYESASTTVGLAGDHLCTASINAGMSGSDVLLSVLGFSATGPANPACEYRFLVRVPGGAGFTEVRPYSTTSTATWTPSVSGRHTFQLQSRYNGNLSAYEGVETTDLNVGTVCNSTNLTLQTTDLQGPVQLSATSTCTGAGTANYRFLALVPGQATLTEIAPYAGTGSTMWDPSTSTPGLYTFVVHSRAAGNNSLYESAASEPRWLFSDAPLDRRELYVTPPGAACAAGGVVMVGGPTRYLCSPTTGSTHSGNFVLTDASLSALAGVSKITGDLTVQTTGVTSISLPSLVEVGGRIKIMASPGLTSVSLPSLIVTGSAGATVPGQPANRTSYSVYMAGSNLQTVSLPALVYSGIEVFQAPNLVTLDLPELESVGTFGKLSFVGVAGADLLAAPNMPKLRGSVGALVIDQMEFTSIAWLSQLSDAGSIKITGNPALQSLHGLESVRAIILGFATVRDGALTISNNAALTSVDLYSLQSSDGTPQITSNAALETCKAWALVDQIKRFPNNAQVYGNKNYDPSVAPAICR